MTVERSGHVVTPPDIAEVFGTQWPRLVATLVREVGDIGLAEDCVQEAFAAASRSWPQAGMPNRPGAWLLAVARRRSIDQIRRSVRLRDLLPSLAAPGEEQLDGPDVSTEVLDDQLRLLLGCCHPALDPQAQVALTLRIVAGLSTDQIARAFLVSEATMTRRLTRAKSKIRDAKIPFTRSDRDALDARLPALCAVVYSIFTEGHASSAATVLVRGDLCEEAVWLAELLSSLLPEEAEVAGLLALLLLIDARRTSRVDGEGRPILIADQARDRWNRPMIARGLAVLARATSLANSGPYQCQAAIAALHATAPDFTSTDWATIVGLYDALMTHHPSPIVALNRAVALRYEQGPQAGLDALETLIANERWTSEVERYAYFHSARAEFLATLGRYRQSTEAFGCALQVSANTVERQHLGERLETVRALAE